jgi:hypothetical protein
MANHVRRQIREAVAARLTGLTTTGARVYVNNVDPLAIGELPALTIRNGSEQIERRSIGSPNPYISRVQTLIVTANARAATAVWDTLDQIAKEVEVAMLGTLDALTLGGLALDTMLVALDDPRISGEGDRLVATMDMQFQIMVNAREGIPDAVI